MALADINWNPSPRQLRQFGLISLVALPLLGWFWSGGNLNVAGGLLCAGVFLAVVGWFYPTTLRPLFVGLTVLATPIAFVVTELALLAIFFGAILPIGLLMRLVGRDPLQRDRDKEAITYWTPRKQSNDPASYYRQF